jgi:hypothetical protein
LPPTGRYGIEWTAIHQTSSFYDLEGFKRGGSRLRDYEVGNVTGKSLLPSRSASAKARSASAWSARKQLGCQPRWLCRDGADQAGRLVPGPPPGEPGW